MPCAPNYRSFRLYLERGESFSMVKTSELYFSLLEDVRRSVRAISSLNLNLVTWKSLLRVVILTLMCNNNQQLTQVWDQNDGLSHIYWRSAILFSTASSISTPICVDETTNKSMFDKSFGHFVRVLIDTNLTTRIRYKILVERRGSPSFLFV